MTTKKISSHFDIDGVNVLHKGICNLSPNQVCTLRLRGIHKTMHFVVPYWSKLFVGL
jgi:hypothetical protein